MCIACMKMHCCFLLNIKHGASQLCLEGPPNCLAPELGCVYTHMTHLVWRHWYRGWRLKQFADIVLHILTAELKAEMIKIWKFRTIHLLILDPYIYGERAKRHFWCRHCLVAVKRNFNKLCIARGTFANHEHSAGPIRRRAYSLKEHAVHQNIIASLYK